MLSEIVIAAMIAIESGGNPAAIGKYGERGILQIRPMVIKEVNHVYDTRYTFPRDALDEINSREIMIRYIAIQRNRFIKRAGRMPTLRETISFWNGGPFGNRKKKALVYADLVLHRAGVCQTKKTKRSRR